MEKKGWVGVDGNYSEAGPFASAVGGWSQRNEDMQLKDRGNSWRGGGKRDLASIVRAAHDLTGITVPSIT